MVPMRATFILIISIHAPREGGDVWNSSVRSVIISISIHAPREGGDKNESPILVDHEISIHAPREGGDMQP